MTVKGAATRGLFVWPITVIPALSSGSSSHSSRRAEGTEPLARHLVSSVSPRSLRSLATRVKRSRLRLGRGCGECEECRKKRPTLSRHHHSSSRGLVLPLLSSPYNHFQAFQSSTVVTGWEASERSGPDQTTGDDDRRRKVGRFLSPRRLFPYRSLPSHYAPQAGAAKRRYATGIGDER